MFRTIFMVATLGTVAACLAHLVVFRPRWVSIDKTKPRIHRFSVWERLIHLVTLVGFLVLAVTGFMASVGNEERLSGLLWVVHGWAAPVFTLGIVAMVVTWASDGRFAPHDLEWAKRFGGYLGGSQDVPAGRLNAGQKGFFWVAGVLGVISMATGVLLVAPGFGAKGQTMVLIAHRYGTLAFVVLGIVHAYLATLANPGTLWSILTGYVANDWAKHHHPLWWEATGGEGSGGAEGGDA
ncbi:MAG: formate dehydrogenase subunit gamma [bacterium]|nr:formate dehydrogenase subunit gamma [bacterium]